MTPASSAQPCSGFDIQGRQMVNIRLIIEYDGTNYHGWQSQDNAVSIQQTIENAINELVPNEKCKLIACSRTDFGVHAFGQTANFHTESAIPPERFAPALNRILPEDIAIRSSERVPDDFHSRYDAVGKRYRYLICNSKYRSAMLRHRACHISHPLDIEKMRSAASYFVGRHDFSAFQATGGSIRDTRKIIYSCTVEREDDNITVEVEGDGFLYNMVRIMAGTLIDVGKGKIPADSIPDIILSRNRHRAGKTAPAQGLYLVAIQYEN
jgi:tRNA pseudouridine38-40 synthase